MNNRKHYDRIAADFADRERHAYHRFLNDATANILAGWLPEGLILDAGCGSGHLAERLNGGSRRIVGLDASRKMLISGRVRRSERRPDSTRSQVSSDSVSGDWLIAKEHMDGPDAVVQSRIESLPFTDCEFDGAFAMRVFPHLAGPAAALAELARVVRPGGAIVLDIYNPVSLRWVARKAAGLAGCEEHENLSTRYDTIRAARKWLPPDLVYRGFGGIRIWTPAGGMMSWLTLGRLLTRMELWGSRSVLKIFGGFLLISLEKAK